jgi:hypothetical protein
MRASKECSRAVALRGLLWLHRSAHLEVTVMELHAPAAFHRKNSL